MDTRTSLHETEWIRAVCVECVGVVRVCVSVVWEVVRAVCVCVWGGVRVWRVVRAVCVGGSTSVTLLMLSDLLLDL